MKALQLFFETVLDKTVMTGTVSTFNSCVKARLKNLKSYPTEKEVHLLIVFNLN